MKTRILALTVALAMPVTAQTATVGIHTFTQIIDVPTITYFPGAGERTTFIYLWDSPGVLLQQGYLSVSASADTPPIDSPNGPYPVRVYLEVNNVVFTVLEDDDFFSFTRQAGGYGLLPGQTIIETITTPLPAALPLFAAGIVTLLARRKRKAMG